VTGAQGTVLDNQKRFQILQPQS